MGNCNFITLTAISITSSSLYGWYNAVIILIIRQILEISILILDTVKPLNPKNRKLARSIKYIYCFFVRNSNVVYIKLTV